MKRSSILLLTMSILVLFTTIGTVEAATIWGNNAGTLGVSKFDAATGVQQFNFYPGGNGRGIVQVGNVLYLTQAASNNVFKRDATTGADLGVAFSIAGSFGLQAIAYDGTNFWVGDYSGTNAAYLYSPTGTLLNTVNLANAAGYYDGLEYFDGKLIANRFDGGLLGPQHYDIYSATDGSLLTPNFIDTTGHGNGTGIAFDGTNFYVSDIRNSQLSIWDGTTGSFLSNLILTGTNYYIEDLSVDYAQREDTGGGNGGNNPVPEPSTFILLGAGLAALGFFRRKNRNH